MIIRSTPFSFGCPPSPLHPPSPESIVVVLEIPNGARLPVPHPNLAHPRPPARPAQPQKPPSGLAHPHPLLLSHQSPLSPIPAQPQALLPFHPPSLRNPHPHHALALTRNRLQPPQVQQHVFCGSRPLARRARHVSHLPQLQKRQRGARGAGPQGPLPRRARERACDFSPRDQAV